jgi:hypothetical protein
MGKYGPGRYGHDKVVMETVYENPYYQKEDEKSFRCMIGKCNETFEYKKELKAHKELVHAL